MSEAFKHSSLTHCQQIDPLELARSAITSPRIFYVCSLYGSSGGMFVSSLFDSHPELFTFPWHLEQYLDLQDFDKNRWEQFLSKILRDEIFFDTSKGNYQSRGDSLHCLGENRDRGIQISRTVFEDTFRRLIDPTDMTARTFGLSIIAAYNLARGHGPATNTFVLYSHDLQLTLRARKHFGMGQIIAVCRHPANVMASSPKGALQRALDRGKLLRPYRFNFVTNYYRLWKGPLANEKLGIVILEELHAHPERSLRSIAQYMGISFDKALLASTMGALKWWGVRVTKFNGFSPILHREVKLNYMGKNAEALVFFCFRRFQQFVGYVSHSRLSLFDALRLFIPGKLFLRYYEDAFISFVALFRKESAFKRKIRLLARFIVDLTSYPFLMMKEIMRMVQSGRMEARVDFSSFIVLNPLSEGTIARCR